MVRTASIIRDTEVAQPVVADTESIEDTMTGAEISRQKSDFARMRDHLAKQPKVRVRLNEDTFAQLNGYTFQIKGGVPVFVPEQVYDLLVEAGRV